MIDIVITPTAGYSPKLDELERNLQAVLQAPTSQVPVNSSYDTDDTVSRRAAAYGSESRHVESNFETRQTYNTYERKQEQRTPAPPPVSECFIFQPCVHLSLGVCPCFKSRSL